MFQEFSTYVITDHATKNHTEKFDLSFKQLEQVNWIGDGGEFSVGGFTVELARSPSPFYTNTFMPTFMVTVTSFLGFVIPVEMVPGRMALLVTIYLMLINIKSSEQNLGPEVSLCHELQSQFMSAILAIFGYYRLMVVWTWTQTPNCVQPLSRLCPISVNVQSLSNHCPNQVQTLSTFCRFLRRMDRVWTSKSSMCPGFVKTRRYL